MNKFTPHNLGLTSVANKRTLLFDKFPELKQKQKNCIKGGIIAAFCVEILGFIVGEPLFSLPCALVIGGWAYMFSWYFCLPKKLRASFFNGDYAPQESNDYSGHPDHSLNPANLNYRQTHRQL